jgi:hypothetical protein
MQGKPNSRMVRRTVAIAGIIWLLGAIMVYVDPGDFLVRWYVD